MQPVHAAPVTSPHATLERALERAAVAGVLVHAVFLPISIAGMQIGLAVSLGALVGLRALGRRVWTRSALDLPCLLLVGAALASLAVATLAGSPPVGWHEATLWRSILSPLLIVSALEVAGARAGAAASAAGRRADPRRLALIALGLWAAASLLPSAVAWAQFWTGFDPLYALGLRRQPVRAVVPTYPGRFAAVGFFSWYQRLAHNLTPPLCLAAAVALHGGVGKRLRALLGVGATAAAIAVVFTLSRAAWVTLVVAALVLALVARRARWWAVLGVVVGALAMGLHPGVQARIRHLSAQGDNTDRVEIWNVCRAVIADHPLTGVGWGNYPRRALPYYERMQRHGKMRAWCHDAFLSAWAEGGPLLCAALVAFWTLLLAAFWLGLRRGEDALARAAAAGALAGVVAMLLNALVHDILYASETVYGLGFATAIGAVLARLTRPHAGAR